MQSRTSQEAWIWIFVKLDVNQTGLNDSSKNINFASVGNVNYSLVITFVRGKNNNILTHTIPKVINVSYYVWSIGHEV